MTTIINGSSPSITFSDGSAQTSATRPFQNRIINGAMQIWQRGTPITTSGGYTADRWTQVSGNSIVHTQSTDAPTGFTNSMQMAGTGSNIAQRIESVNCIGLGGATVTVSLWYKNSTGSDPLSLSLYYANSADNFGSVTQIGSNQTLSASPSSSWTYYTVTFTNISANAINGLALYVFRGSSATATGLLTGVQLEVGSTATSFDYLDYGRSLIQCQRYYQQINKINSVNFQPYGVGAVTSSTNAAIIINLPVVMRTSPSFTFNNPTNTYTGYTGFAVTSVSIDISSPCVIMYVTVTSGMTAGQGARHYQNSGNPSSLELSAEL